MRIPSHNDWPEKNINVTFGSGRVDIFYIVCAQIIVTVWKQEEEKAEIQEHGYLSILQQKSPCQTFRQDLNTFKAQGKYSLSIDLRKTRQHITCSVSNAALTSQNWEVRAQNDIIFIPCAFELKLEKT